MADNSKKKTGKKKYKFTVMDYVTIGFTAVVVIIMIVFLIKTVKPEWFSKKGNDDTTSYATQYPSQSTPGATAGPTAEPTAAPPTQSPVYSGIGNTYGNMSNNALAAEIDGRLYYVVGNSDGTYDLIVRSGGTDRVIITGEAAISSVNAIKDPFTYGYIADSVAYKIMYVDGDGRIVSVTDGPYPYGDGSLVKAEDAKITEKAEVAEGTFRSFVSVGEYLYCIDSEGLVIKSSLATKEKTALSSEKYSSLCVYYGMIYALGEDGSIYVLGTSPAADVSSGATETPEDGSSGATEAPEGGSGDEGSATKLGGGFSAIAVFDDWIYAVGESGAVRYDADTYGRDSLGSSVKPAAINVNRSGIYLLVRETGDDGQDNIVLYSTSAMNLLSGKLSKMASFPAGGEECSCTVTLASDRVLVSVGGKISSVSLT